MKDLNHIILSGRVTRDAEVKEIGEGITAVNFSIAFTTSRKTNGEWSEKTNFIDCLCFGSFADAIKDIPKKGVSVVVMGVMEQDTWESSDGKKNSKIVVKVTEIRLVNK